MAGAAAKKKIAPTAPETEPMTPGILKRLKTQIFGKEVVKAKKAVEDDGFRAAAVAALAPAKKRKGGRADGVYRRTPIEVTDYGTIGRKEYAWTQWTKISYDNTVTMNNDIQVWNTWTDTGTAGTFTANNVIQTWNTGTGTANTVTFDDAYQVWATHDQIEVDFEVTAKATWNHWMHGAPALHIGARRAAETDEQRLEREEREVRRIADRAEQDRKWNAVNAERKKAREVIDVRAEGLLMSLLNAEQRKDWIGSGQFFLHVEDRTYRIKRGTHGNVDLVDDNRQPLENFCGLPGRDRLPVADVVAGQLLALKCDEENFIKTAAASRQKVGHIPLKERVRNGTLRMAA